MWVEASERLPVKRDSYLCFDKELNVKRLLFFNNEARTKKSLLITNPKRYKWYDEVEPAAECQIVKLMEATGCMNILDAISYVKELKCKLK